MAGSVATISSVKAKNAVFMFFSFWSLTQPSTLVVIRPSRIVRSRIIRRVESRPGATYPKREGQRGLLSRKTAKALLLFDNVRFGHQSAERNEADRLVRVGRMRTTLWTCGSIIRTSQNEDVMKSLGARLAFFVVLAAVAPLNRKCFAQTSPEWKPVE